MPKKTRLQKMRAAQHTSSAPASKDPSVRQDSIKADWDNTKSIKSDMFKSIVLALLITVFEIALYFVYYQRVWERR